MAREPEPAGIEVPEEEQVDTVDADQEQLLTAPKHVLSDGSGKFPLGEKLNRWERVVIAQETAEKTVAL